MLFTMIQAAKSQRVQTVKTPQEVTLWQSLKDTPKEFRSSGDGKMVSKIIVASTDGRYLFAVKKQPKDPRKDKHLELYGGKLEKGEDFTTALLRELGEEDPSLSLLHTVKEHASQLKVLALAFKKSKKSERHWLYYLTLDPQKFDALTTKIQPSPETYGFEVKSKWNPLSAEFTPKTRSLWRKVVGM